MTETRVAAATSPPDTPPETRRSTLARPPAMRGSPYLWLAAFLLVVGLTRQFGSFGAGDSDLLNRWLFYSVLVIGFYFVFGVSGQFAFSQAAFAAVGGYTSWWAVRNEVFGTDTFWVGIIVGVAVACILAAGFSLLMRRASEFYLAIATLGLSEIILEILRKWNDFTGSAGDVSGGIKPIDYWFGHEVSQLNQYAEFWVWFVAFGIVMVDRDLARALAGATRDDRDARPASGRGDPRRSRRSSDASRCSCSAPASRRPPVRCSSHTKGFANPDDFSITLGLGIFVILIIGGIDSRWGPVVGAAFYVFVPQWLQGGIFGISGLDFTVKVFGQEHRFGDFRDIFFGSLLVITMIAFPEGLVGIGRRIRAKTFGKVIPERRTWLSDMFGLTPKRKDRPSAPARAARSTRRSTAVSTPRSPTRPTVIEAEDIRVQFGGVVAVDGVSLALHDNEILGLVGPNGSGKTTFLNALTGVVDATGTMRVLGNSVGLGRPGRIRGFGVLRTFQAPQTYTHLTCIEDVVLSTTDRKYTGITSSWFARPPMDHHERDRWAGAMVALDRVGLADLAEAPTVASVVRTTTAARARTGDLRRAEGTDARRAVGGPQRRGDRPARGLPPGAQGRRGGDPAHRPQARLHHVAVRPRRGARARPPGRGGPGRDGVRRPASRRRVSRCRRGSL